MPASDRTKKKKKKEHSVKKASSDKARIKMLEIAVKNAEQITKKIAMTCSDAILILDPNGMIMYASDQAAQLYGVRRSEDLVDMSAVDMVVPEQRAFVTENLAKVFREGFSAGIEYTVVRHDGSRFFASVNAAVVTAIDKRPVSLVCTVRDITDSKKTMRLMNDTRETYLSVFEGVNDAIVVVDPVLGKVVQANERFCRMRGIAKAQLQDFDISSFASGDPGFTVQDIFVKIKEAMETGGCLFEWKSMTPTGEHEWTEVSLKRSLVEGKVRLLGIIRDITHKKLAAQELEKSFAVVNKIMSGIIQAMEKLVEKKDEYTVGHQKRTGMLARAIAIDMGLPHEQVNSIYISAVIHDIGKIFVSGKILNKKGKLDMLEYDEIKKHPEAGYEVLKSIQFPWPIADIVRQHHERLDGSGYPFGLKGDDIYLESRIISIADVVEAITFARPYREAYGIDRALEELIAGRGKLYDPEITDVCVNLFRKKGFVLEDKADEEREIL